MGKISVVINTFNEEKNLPRALASVKGLADEILVVDMHSKDRTVAIAKKHGAKVYLHKPTGYVEPARNFAVSKATNDWVLILDADERIPSMLGQELRKIVKTPQADYYRLARKNIIFGKWIKHSRWWPDYNIRFFKKGAVVWSEIIHCVPETKGRGLDIPSQEELAIVHYNYLSVTQFIERMNRYSTKQAKLKIKDGHQFSWLDLIKKPTNEFLSRYFEGQGYKDGIHGLALAFLQSFSELVVYLKIWETQGFKKKKVDLISCIKEMKKVESDFHYWQADTLLKEKGGIIPMIKRKLKL